MDKQHHRQLMTFGHENVSWTVGIRYLNNPIKKVKVVASLMLLLVCISTSEQLSGDGTTMTELMGYMTKFGYLPSTTSAISQLMSADEIQEATKVLQRVAGLPQTGILDDATSEFINRRRCGVSDASLVETLKEASASRGRRRKRYQLYKEFYRWRKTSVTWTLNEDSRKVHRPEVLEEFRKAFRLWSDASSLRFTELRPGSGSSADIVVRFAYKDHGDRYQFDGPGRTLAHAFPPSGNSDMSGDLHMDDDEAWAVNRDAIEDTYSKTSIFVVAAHELGHSLGLDHSPDKEAIMYAAYMGAKEYPVLPPDDTAGIQQLYGPNPHSSRPQPPRPDIPPTRPIPRHPSPTRPIPRYPVPTTTTESPHSAASTSPDICKSTFDAIAAIRGELHFFKDQYMWRLTGNNDLYGPLLISSFWQGLPTDVQKIDAAYEKPMGRYEILLFSGNRYWTFEDTRMAIGPQALSTMGLPHHISKVDGALVWGHKGTTYLFSGNYYWKMDNNQNMIRSDYPKDITAWEGVTYPITSAVRWTDGKTYFFKDNLFWTFNETTMLTDQPGKPIHPHWFHCPSESIATLPSFVLVLVSFSTVIWSFWQS